MSNTSHPLSYKALEPMSWCQISNIIHDSAKKNKLFVCYAYFY